MLDSSDSDVSAPGRERRRFLVVTLDAAGNWPPEIALVRALASRGHEVRVLSNAVHARAVAEAGAIFVGHAPELERDPTTRRDESPEVEMARVMRDVFLNPRFADALLAEVDRDAPDVLVVDQMLVLAAMAAESTRLPTAVLWHTVYFGGLRGRTPPPPEVLAPMHALRARLGLGPAPERWAGAQSADAIVAFTYEQFDVPAAERPRNLHYVGPLACIPGEETPSYDLPWAPDDPRPLVLVSYSTSFQSQVPALQRVADAVAGLPARVLMTLGRAIARDELDLPPDVVAESFVPHAAVLPRTRLVVTHAGHGTVMAAVTAGVPVVCTPMGRDQHGVAACVERCGLGAIVPVSATVEEMRSAIASALADDALRARSRAFAAGLDLGAGLRRAIGVLEGLGGADGSR